MDEPGGEMEASDRRLCCETQTDKEKKRRENAHDDEITGSVFIPTFWFQILSHPESPLCPRCLLA